MDECHVKGDTAGADDERAIATMQMPSDGLWSLQLSRPVVADPDSAALLLLSAQQGVGARQPGQR